MFKVYALTNRTTKLPSMPRRNKEMKDAATQTSEEDTEEVEVPWFLDNQPGVVIESEESGEVQVLDLCQLQINSTASVPQGGSPIEIQNAIPLAAHRLKPIKKPKNGNRRRRKLRKVQGSSNKVQCTYVIDIPQGPLQYYVRICGDYRRVTGYMGGY